MEHNCRNLGGYGRENPVKEDDGVWRIRVEDDYYYIEVKYCPYCGIEL